MEIMGSGHNNTVLHNRNTCNKSEKNRLIDGLRWAWAAAMGIGPCDECKFARTRSQTRARSGMPAGNWLGCRMRRPMYMHGANSQQAGTAHGQRDEERDRHGEGLAAGGGARRVMAADARCLATTREMGLGWVGVSDSPPL